MQNGSSVQCGGISQLRLNQCLTLLCARLLTICFTLCSDSRSVQLPFNICHQASAACRQGFLVLSLLASMSFGIGTDKVLQEEQPVAMEDAPTSPRAIFVQPAASALPHIYCRVASAQSSKHPLLPSESSPEVSLRSISVQDKATVQHSSSDAQSASRDIEPMAAGQHHAPSISVVQGSMPGDEVRCAPAASYNIVTSGEYASAIEHETTVSIAPGNPLSAPPHAHLISDEITGSDSSQELPQHYSKQQDFFQTLSELQDHTCSVTKTRIHFQDSPDFSLAATTMTTSFAQTFSRLSMPSLSMTLATNQSEIAAAGVGLQQMLTASSIEIASLSKMAH